MDAGPGDVGVVPLERGARIAVATLVDGRATDVRIHPAADVGLDDRLRGRSPGRIVWQDAKAVAPVLLDAAVPIDRVRDVRLVHRILAEARGLPAEERWARSLRSDAEGLFSLAPEAEPLDALAEQLRLQDAAIGDDPGLAMLAAAESMGAVVAVELGREGLPFDRARHDALLVARVAGRAGGKAAPEAGLGGQVRTNESHRRGGGVATAQDKGQAIRLRQEEPPELAGVPRFGQPLCAHDLAGFETAQETLTIPGRDLDHPRGKLSRQHEAGPHETVQAFGQRGFLGGGLHRAQELGDEGMLEQAPARLDMRERLQEDAGIDVEMAADQVQHVRARKALAGEITVQLRAVDAQVAAERGDRGGTSGKVAQVRAETRAQFGRGRVGRARRAGRKRIGFVHHRNLSRLDTSTCYSSGWGVTLIRVNVGMPGHNISGVASATPDTLLQRIRRGVGKLNWIL